MLAFLPVGFLLLAALLVYLLRNLKHGFGYAWFVAFLASLLAWGAVLAFHWIQVPDVLVPPWRHFEPVLADLIIFRWDATSWPYALMLASVNLAVISSSPVRFQLNSTPRVWAANIAFAALGLFGLLAASPLALIFLWMLLDLAEFFYFFRGNGDVRTNEDTIRAFSLRLAGIFLVLAAMVYSYAGSGALTFASADPVAGLLILIGAIFRMGIYPVVLPAVNGIPQKRGITTTLLVSSQLTALLPLARLSTAPAPESLHSGLVALTVLGCIYAAILWLTSRDELSGRQYWFIALDGLAVLSCLTGHTEGSRVWGVLLAAASGIIFLYSIRGRGFSVFPALAVLGLSALPFTPAASGWESIPATTGMRVTLILVLALLAIGYVRHALRPESGPSGPENWGLLTYSIGLFALGGSPWLVTFLGLPGGLALGWLPGGLILTVLIAGGGYLAWRGIHVAEQLQRPTNWLVRILGQATEGLARFLQFNWLLKLLDGIYRLVQSLLLMLGSVFEGDGGVLWALLLLALLLTFFGSGVLTQ